ncbi:hypothetical protein PHLGIDRAFT_125189 [Phlebiopsis gigantea 11061_1 CR5-6]|uniref:DUF6534 domain-containing protein n=1 Tax=Phlebiopsis gigantea (strain 11061_1 CR5-6) TaxID=745531 RepID=A0A0C3P027_PHLG1|nr:hypothetical protein PHLGIDRAFT_125189 [Phlebiopsis gigantea 11061_1 CR5-6]
MGPSVVLPSYDASSNVHETLGVLFLANIFVAILFAITSVQTYIYYHQCAEDGRWMKNVVFFLWGLDALHFAFSTHTVYHYAVSNFTNPGALAKETFSLAGNMIVAGISDLIVTFVLTFRIWKFNTEKTIVKVVIVVIVIASIFMLGSDIAVPILALRGSATYLEFQQHYSWLWYITFGTRAGVDLIIAASFYVMLHPYRSGFRRTSSVIRLVILYTINTCALTSVFAILSVVLYAAIPTSFIGFATAMQLPKLMLNSLLAVLNSRKRMREIISAHDSLAPSALSRPVVLPTSASTRSLYQNKVPVVHHEELRPMPPFFRPQEV